MTGGDAFLAEAGVAPENRQFEFAFLGRYEYQSFEIEVPFEVRDGKISAADLPTLVEAFHKMHERIYSIRADGDVVEFTAWKLRAIGKRSGQDIWQKNTLADQAGRGRRTKGSAASTSRKPAASRRCRSTTLHAVWARAPQVDGPCLVEAETFTAYLKRDHHGADRPLRQPRRHRRLMSIG